MIPVGECAVFALTFGASAAAPGPEMAALLGRSVSRGLLNGGPLALGIIIGKLVMLCVAVAGLAALVPVLGPVFVVPQVLLSCLSRVAWHQENGGVAVGL